MEVNYDDKRFTEVEEGKQVALSEVEQTYGAMIDNSDKYYQKQIDAAQDYADTQTQLQQERTDFAIEQIEQQKDQAHKDYIKEQSGAYADWQKQSNAYSANAEKMAAGGMSGTGYSESSQVSMYNAYQNRVASARESYNQAVLNYDNAIKDARLQNSAALAEIAYTALQQQLELSLQGFQYKNNLIIALADKKADVENTYHARYQDVLSQINTENALAEEVRQYNASLKEEQRQYNASLKEEQRQYDASLKEEQRQFKKTQKAKQAAEDKIEKAQEEENPFAGIKGTYTPTTVTGDGEKITSVTKGSAVSATAKSTEKSSVTVDMQSVLALGYGPISAAKLNQLVASGEVVEYEQDGKLKYRKAFRLGH